MTSNEQQTGLPAHHEALEKPRCTNYFEETFHTAPTFHLKQISSCNNVVVCWLFFLDAVGVCQRFCPFAMIGLKAFFANDLT